MNSSQAKSVSVTGSVSVFLMSLMPLKMQSSQCANDTLSRSRSSAPKVLPSKCCPDDISCPSCCINSDFERKVRVDSDTAPSGKYLFYKKRFPVGRWRDVDLRVLCGL